MRTERSSRMLLATAPSEMQNGTSAIPLLRMEPEGAARCMTSRGDAGDGRAGGLTVSAGIGGVPAATNDTDGADSAAAAPVVEGPVEAFSCFRLRVTFGRWTRTDPIGLG